MRSETDITQLMRVEEQIENDEPKIANSAREQHEWCEAGKNSVTLATSAQ